MKNRRKQYAALARVSSREQEREGFSLDVQVDGFRRYAESQGGEIIELFRIAETASKAAERKTFKELVGFVKKHAETLDGLLFYKVDRASRNLFDYVELERLEQDYSVPVIYITQPTENTPAGRMMRRTLANMAAFYTEQQSLDVREGMERRVASGLPPQKPSYGYRNVRIEGRSLIEIDPVAGPIVRRIFELYAFGAHTIDSVLAQLEKDGIQYRPGRPTFSRSHIHKMLRDRTYIGEVLFRGQWHPGKFEPLIDRATWDRVQVLLGEKVYRSYELTYSGGLIVCGHCGSRITGESKTKLTKAGPRQYIYYRCSLYNQPEHPRVRLSEEKLDKQVLGLLAQLRVQDDEIRHWFQKQLREVVNSEQRESSDRIGQFQRQLAVLRKQQDELLNLRLLGEINSDTFASKSMELRDRESRLNLEIEGCGRGRHENADTAVKAFELSQNLAHLWVKADFAAKRRYLEILVLNFSLNDVSLVPVWRKPFDLLAKGLSVHPSRGDWI